MPDKKISQLPVGEFNSSTIFPLVTNGITSQNTYTNLVTSLEPYFSGGSGGSQDLQQVLDVGNSATDSVIVLFDNNGNTVLIMGGESGYSNTNSDTSEAVGLGSKSYFDSSSNWRPGLRIQGTSSSGSTTSYLLTEDSQTRGVFKLPNKGIFAEHILVTRDELPTTGSFECTVTSAGAGVVLPGNTWVRKFYWTRVGNTVTCSAEVSIEISQDVSSNGARIVFNLPFTQSNDETRTNVGNGVLAGGGIGNGIFAPAFIQMEDQTHANVTFYGRAGNNSGSYQGEIHLTYIVQ